MKKTWADIMDTPQKRTVEEVIAKSLKERDNQEKERQNRRRNIIVFELPESKKSEPEDRKEDIKKFVGFCKGIIKINFDHSMIEHIIRLGKAMDDKHRLLLISLKGEDKKQSCGGLRWFKLKKMSKCQKDVKCQKIKHTDYGRGSQQNNKFT